MKIPVIPDSAPFSPSQRAWLSGFFAAMLTSRETSVGPAGPIADAFALGGSQAPATTLLTAATVEEEFPWRDSSMSIDDRLALAADRPIELKLMSAMAQLDCGSCGYLCQTYAEAIAKGEEKDLTRCSPGGTHTAKTLKRLLLEGVAPSPVAATAELLPSRSNGHAICSANGHAKTQPGSSKKHPYVATLISNERLTASDTGKDTRHVVIDLGDSQLTYEPGDSLGILPQNDPAMIDDLLRSLGATGDEVIASKERVSKSLRALLIEDYVINKTNQQTLEFLSDLADAPGRSEMETAIAADENPLLLDAVADVIRRFAIRNIAIDSLVEKLSPLQPRLYSIASSQAAHPREVHLTMGVAEYQCGDVRRYGIASHYAGVRLQAGDPVKVFFHPSKFRLPADPAAPIILIGPGTGIAPFRGFLEHRDKLKMPGKTWLFFGNQSRTKDYLYQTEIEDFVARGVITRLSLAFSRDQAQKRYVQDEMLEQSAELWQWLEAGATIYICGDAKRMAADVDKTLTQIISQQAHLSVDDAKKKLQEWSRNGRYKRDVY